MESLKLILIALILLSANVLYASTPEDVVNSTLAAIKDRDFEQYLKYVDIPTMILFKGVRSKTLENSPVYVQPANDFDSILSLYRKQLKQDVYFYSFSMSVFKILLKRDIPKDFLNRKDVASLEEFKIYLKEHFKDISTIENKVVRIAGVSDFDIKKDYYILLSGLNRMFLMYVSLEENKIGLTDGQMVKVEIMGKDVTLEEKVYLCLIDGEWKVFGSEKGLIPMIPGLENEKQILLQLQQQYLTSMSKWSKVDMNFIVTADGETRLDTISSVAERRTGVKFIGKVLGTLATLTLTWFVVH